jgi:hypothetical protein
MSPEPESTAELLEDRVVSLAPVGPRSKGPSNRWVLLVGAVVVVLGAALLSARWSVPPLAAVASPSPPSSASAPTPAVAGVLQPTASPDNGACGTGTVQFQVNAQPVAMVGLEQIRVPAGGTLAVAIEDSTTTGSLVLAKAHAGDAATTDAGVIATYTGVDTQLVAVQPIGWSASGDALLVNAGHRAISAVDVTCNDFYLLQAEGSTVRLSSLAEDGSARPAGDAALSADGARIAYFQQNEFRPQTELRLIDVHSGEPGIGLVGCSGPLPPPRWSPDQTRILAICDNALVIADVDARDWQAFPPTSPDSVVLAAGWTADSTSIMTVAAETDRIASNRLDIAKVDALTGIRSDRAVSPTNTPWIVGSASMSPDGRWALVQGNDTYAIDTATGTAASLPWIVFPNPFDLATVAWLSGGNSFLYANMGTLYQVDLGTMTRAEIGAVPTSSFAWHELQP